jgi:hypothetical protein
MMAMAAKRFRLSARVSSKNPAGIRGPIEEFVGAWATINPTEDGFQVGALVAGNSAKELNRRLLSAMRRIEKRTRLRAEWTSEGMTERFFDYVSKGTRRSAE